MSTLQFVDLFQVKDVKGQDDERLNSNCIVVIMSTLKFVGLFQSKDEIERTIKYCMVTAPMST